jgi:DNA-binding NtrC family response regulator
MVFGMVDERGGADTGRDRGASTMRVLVVDDDPIQREFAKFNLTAEGMEVVTCSSVDSALQELKRTSYHVVVTDFDMPGRNGHDLIKIVRALGLSLPIILVTGSQELSTVNLAYKIGATSFALKPVVWKTLAAQIRSALST